MSVILTNDGKTQCPRKYCGSFNLAMMKFTDKEPICRCIICGTEVPEIKPQ